MKQAFADLPPDLVGDLLSVDAVRGVFPTEGSQALQLHLTEPCPDDVPRLCALLGRPVPVPLRVHELLEQLDALEELAELSLDTLRGASAALSEQLRRPSLQRRLTEEAREAALGLVRDAGELIAERHGFSVVAIRRLEEPRCHDVRLDIGDPIVAAEDLEPSTLTLVRNTNWWGPGATAIATAHGVIDLFPGSSTVRKELDSRWDSVWVGAHPAPGAGRANGFVARALLGPESDFSILKFPDVETNRRHPAPGIQGDKPTLAPPAYASYNAPVAMWPSRVTGHQGSRRAGTLKGFGAVELGMRVGHVSFRHTYHGVYFIEPVGPRFSIGGDSGTLVVVDGFALGIVVGGSERRGESYVLPLEPLKQLHGGVFNAFFRT